MNSRERLETALDHKEPDRVPIDLGAIVSGITSGANEALTQHLGIPTDNMIIDRVQQLARPLAIPRHPSQPRVHTRGSAPRLPPAPAVRRVRPIKRSDQP